MGATTEASCGATFWHRPWEPKQKECHACALSSSPSSLHHYRFSATRSRLVSRLNWSLQRSPSLPYKTPGSSPHNKIDTFGVDLSTRSHGPSQHHGELYHWWQNCPNDTPWPCEEPDYKKNPNGWVMGSIAPSFTDIYQRGRTSALNSTSILTSKLFTSIY